MNRIVMSCLLLALAGTGATIYKRPDLTAKTRDWMDNLFGSPEAGYPPEKFRVDLVDRINYQRITAKNQLIHVDVQLEQWLTDHAAELDLNELNQLTEQIKKQHPRYQRIVTCTASNGNLQSLLGEFHDFSTSVEKDMTHIAIHLVRLKAGLGYQGLVVTGKKMEDFTPEGLSAGQSDTFFTTCPHCNYQHACKVVTDQRGINLECPKCGLSYGVLAADERGHFKYVNEFLTGYSPPAHFPFDTNPLHQMYTIWSAVVSHCSYTKDTTRTNRKRDSWQTALETQTRMRGDCEDSSVFLADWLLSRGFQVRVALGHYGDMGGHAWCIARIDGIDYLLESTEGPPDPSKPPYVSDVGARYVPDTLFDRDAIYVRAKPKERFDGDYWSPKTWIRVQPRKFTEERLATTIGPKTASRRGPTTTVTPTNPIANRSVQAKHESPIATIEAMKELKAGQMEWQVPVVISQQTPPTGLKSDKRP